MSMPGIAGGVIDNSADPTQSINVQLAVPGTGLSWIFGGACCAFSADPATACQFQVYVRTVDNSSDEYLLFEAPITKGGPAPIYLPRGRVALPGRSLRLSLAADAGGAVGYLIPDVWQGVS